MQGGAASSGRGWGGGGGGGWGWSWGEGGGWEQKSSAVCDDSASKTQEAPRAEPAQSVAWR
jgi:hypothetical protein